MKKSRVINRKEIITGVVAVAVFVVAGLLCEDNSMLIRFTRIAVMALYAISLNIQYGYGGMTNLGSSLYFAMSGYTVLYLMSKFGWSLGPSILVALVFVLVFSLVFGYVCLQRGMATFAFLGMGICILFSQYIAKTKSLGGATGLLYQATPAWMLDMHARYFITLAFVVICAALIYLFTKSPLVATLKGARENEERLLFLGVNVKRLRLIVFVTSSLFMGIAGVLYTLLNNSVGPKTLDVSISLQALFMCIMGGSMVFLGPVLGAIIVTLILTYVSSWTIYYNLVLGVIMLLGVYFMPHGILGGNSKITYWLTGKQNPNLKIVETKRKDTLSATKKSIKEGGETL